MPIIMAMPVTKSQIPTNGCNSTCTCTSPCSPSSSLTLACQASLKLKKISRKKVFAKFVNSKLVTVSHHEPISKQKMPTSWRCCDEIFTAAVDIHKHAAKCHSEVIDEAMALELQRISCDRKNTKVCAGRNASTTETSNLFATSNFDHTFNCHDKDGISVQHNNFHRPVFENDFSRPCAETWLPVVSPMASGDSSPWLPSQEECSTIERGQILLFYKYVDIEEPNEVAIWQRELCQRLHLTGKIRIATEGINGTVGGTLKDTELYVQYVLAHPLFQDMTSKDFKRSKGGSDHFPNGLKVGIHQEIVPMGVDPKILSYKQAGTHLTPSDFHQEIEHHIDSRNKLDSRDTLFLDCRNFYESKIGQFQDAVTPNIRKFSYWPEYVDKNLDLFQDKRVIMYCTGGIRCERGSAYLKSKGICKEILQLRGGIHKYLEDYPNGHFKGKLFVFDDRYAIQTNNDVIANCTYCDKPWDQYQPCSSSHCHQLVLACPGCRTQGLTACCKRCHNIATQAENSIGCKLREECQCTRNRERVPHET